MDMNQQVEELYSLFLKFPEVCTDSREVKAGSLFFALKGPNFNGNKFAQSALDQGAAFAVVDEKDFATGDKMFLVGNVLESLQSLSKFHRSKLQIPIIGITGSNGKTTSKELISCVLSTTYNVVSTVGNLNNHIGVPLSILRITPDHDIAVIEMGSNGHGEIEFLCDLCQPDYGIITSIGKAHLEGFGDLEGVVNEKTALYRSVGSRNGIIIFNTESQYLQGNLPPNTQNIGYSSQGSYAFELGVTSTFPIIEGLLSRGDKEIKLSSRMYGDYNIGNIVSAITIGDLFDINIDKSITAINQYLPKNNRSEMVQFEGANIYLDAYNANPSSVALVVKQFGNSAGEKILILGDMLEVGEYEDKEHDDILSVINPKQYKEVILLGKLFFKHKESYPTFKFFEDFKNLKIYFSSLDKNQKNILLKGSRGMGLERLIR